MGAGRVLFAALLVLASASCSAVTDPGRFQFGGAAGCPAGDASDLAIELRNFQEYEDERIHVMVVDGTNFLVFRAIIDGLDTDGVSEDGTDNSTLLCLNVPELVEFHDGLVVRTFVDLDPTGFYEPLDGAGAPFEPGWQDDVVDSVVVVDATEEPTGFDNPSFSPGNVAFSMENMAPHTPGTQHLAVMVIDQADGIPVGFYRIADVDVEDPFVEINEVLQPDSGYVIEFYADFIQNGFYDPPPMGDHSWLEVYTSDAAGDLNETFVHVFEFDVLDYF